MFAAWIVCVCVWRGEGGDLGPGEHATCCVPRVRGDHVAGLLTDVDMFACDRPAVGVGRHCIALQLAS